MTPDLLQKMMNRLEELRRDIERLRVRDHGPARISQLYDIDFETDALMAHQILRYKISDNIWVNRFTALFTGPALSRTVVAGVIDVATSVTSTNITILGEGSLADDVDTITSDQAGHIIVVRRDPTTTITLKDGTGNLRLPADIVLDSDEKAVWLLYTGSNDWIPIAGYGSGTTGPVTAHTHAGEDIVSGTVADARIASTITRDSEVFGIVLAADGAGSGLDADLLDGLSSAAFALAAHVHSGADITTGTVADARIASTITRDSEVFGIVLAADGAGSGLDADLLDGLSSAAFALVSHVHAGEDITTGTVADARIASTITRDSEVFTIVLAADGAGSGLDADLLDGLSSAAFALASHVHSGADITTGTVADARIASTITRDSEVMTIVLAADGAGSGLDADLLDGLSSAAFALAAHVHDHGTNTGLTDDDHTIYLLAAGTRALTGDWSAGGFDIILDNTQFYRVRESGGTARGLVGMSAANLVQIGAQAGSLVTSIYGGASTPGLTITGLNVAMANASILTAETIQALDASQLTLKDLSGNVSLASLSTGWSAVQAAAAGLNLSLTARAANSQIAQYLFGTKDSGGVDRGAAFGHDGANIIIAPTTSISGRTDWMMSLAGNVTLGNGLYQAQDILRARDSGGLRLEDDAGTLAIFIEDGGQIGIGTLVPDRNFLVVGTPGVTGSIGVKSYGTGLESHLVLYTPRGIEATPTANLADDLLGSIYFGGWDTALSNGAKISAVASADWGTAADTSDNPTDLVFYTVPDGSGALTERLRIGSNGAVDVTGTFNVSGAVDLDSTLLVNGAVDLDTTLNVDGITTLNDQVNIKAGGSSGAEARVGGIMFVSTTQAGNITGGEDLLLSYSVPASTLENINDSIWFEAAGTLAANTNAKILRVHFGTAGTSLIATSDSISINAIHNWHIRGHVFRIGATTQKAVAVITIRQASGGGTVTASVGLSVSLSQTLANAITLRITGEGVATNDIIQDILKVGFDPFNT